MNQMLAQVKALQDYVSTISGYPFQAAGGCVRDALWERIPKDYDMVYCPGDISDSEAFTMIAELAKTFRILGWRVAVYQAYGTRADGAVSESSFESMFFACLKIDGENLPSVDILLSKYSGLDEHISHHDCNANMVYLTPGGEVVGCVRPTVLLFRDGIEGSRIEYMTNKYNVILAEDK
ncbi:MAG: hypothetical protein [Caudoviricetes sp.]|nr:MAG: hypothetical protein [Caudoviricetes sp.]